MIIIIDGNMVVGLLPSSTFTNNNWPENRVRWLHDFDNMMIYAVNSMHAEWTHSSDCRRSPVSLVSQINYLPLHFLVSDHDT
jgi:hypothetical protein